MTTAARDPRQQCRAEQALSVDDLDRSGVARSADVNRAMSRQLTGENNACRQRRVATGITSDTAGCSRTSGANASSTTQENRACGNRCRASVSAGI